MDNQGLVGEIIEKGQSTAQAGTKNLVQSVQSQVGISGKKTPLVNSANSVPQQNTNQEPLNGENQIQNTKRTSELVQDFYAPTENNSSQITVQEQEQIDTDQKLLQVRQKLHQELHNEVYFNALNNPTHNEEKVADKVEREDKEKMQELQMNEAKKPDDQVLRRAQTTTERVQGTGG